MKASELIEKLRAATDKFGDLAIVGGYLGDDTGMTKVCVVDSEGMEVWPNDPNCVAGENEIDGLFFE